MNKKVIKRVNILFYGNLLLSMPSPSLLQVSSTACRLQNNESLLDGDRASRRERKEEGKRKRK